MPRHAGLLTVMIITAHLSAADAAVSEPPHGLSDSDPSPNPEAVVEAGNARFTVLTPALIRMEWSEDGVFEDRATFAFINRNLPAPPFAVEQRDDGRLVIRTDEVTLAYDSGGGRFEADNLEITLSLNGEPVTWRPGTPDTGNLLGTVRTLDGVSGETPLPPGLLSRDGWALVDDSDTWVFDDSDWPWATLRADREAIDWYLFGHGHDYRRALRDFTLVSGRIPMPPRYVLGPWWSRYWDYTQQEFEGLVAEYEQHDVPLEILVIDMDWHLEGWTGYTWNRELIPDPEGFLDWIHEQGLRTTLNLHPHNGVASHEEAFPEFAEAMGLDPEEIDRVPIQITDRRYVEAYFDLLHHPQEENGVDFWWIDWQQGEGSGLEGLDPLTWLNYLHWTDMERNTARGDLRPLIFSRWGGLGNHRHQIGFSGDTYSDWDSLAFQPHFTSTAGNVGYGWWSHDIGGHQPGPVEGELYARWIQWGALSPILRTHGTKNDAAERRIWAFGDEVFRVAREAFRLRRTLAPHIYGAARQAYDEALPLVRPLYHEWPELDEAYERSGQYLFGDDLLVAPVAQPVDPTTHTAVVTVWFPPGDWTHWFTGQTFEGPSEAALAVPLDEIPLFVRGGAIIPTSEVQARLGDEPFNPLVLNIHPGNSLRGETRIYEDDNLTNGYRRGECAWTPVRWQSTGNVVQVDIGPANGSFDGQLRERRHTVVLHDVWPPSEVRLGGEIVPEGESAPAWTYDEATYTLKITLAERDVFEETTVEIVFGDEAVDRSLLTAGARGRVRLLREITTALGVESLLGWDAAADLRANTHAAMTADWVEALRVADRDGADPDDLAHAFMRLAGLHAKTLATATETEPGRLTVRASIGALEQVEGLTGRLEFEVPEGWTAHGEPVRDLGELRPGVEVVETLQVEPQGGPVQPGQLVVHHVFSAGGFEISLPVRRELYPSVSAWQIIGPFDNPEGISVDRVFPPEEVDIDLAASYPGMDDQVVRWRPVIRSADSGPAINEDFVVNFHEVFGGENSLAAAYAAVWIDCPETTDALLALGTDDGVVAWLNGEEVHRHSVGRPYVPRQDQVPIVLQAGRNELLLKISQGDRGWEFCAWLLTLDGDPLRGIDYVLEPGG